MTIVSPMGQLRPVFADKNGKRLSGGKVFTYEPGTLTPKATYTDALNSIPNTNPINLDGSGEADIYLDGGYRMQVYDRYGTLIQDVDNFRTWASGIPAESILYGSQDLKQFNADVETSLVEINAALSTKASNEYVDNQLSLKAPQSSTYTKIEVDSALSTKAPQATTYTKAEVDTTFAAYVGGRKAYTTLALAQADQANLPVNTAIEVTNDGVNNGTYQWNGTTLTKSAYDPLTQAKAYTDQEINVIDLELSAVDTKLIQSTIVPGFEIQNTATLFLTNASAKYQRIDVTGLTEFVVANGVENSTWKWNFLNAAYARLSVASNYGNGVFTVPEGAVWAVKTYEKSGVVDSNIEISEVITGRAISTIESDISTVNSEIDSLDNLVTFTGNTKTEIAYTPIAGSYVNINTGSPNTVLVARADTSYLKIDVEGYKRLIIESSSAEWPWVFRDQWNQIIQFSNYAGSGDFTIPKGAKYAYRTFNYTHPQLENSDMKVYLADAYVSVKTKLSEQINLILNGSNAFLSPITDAMTNFMSSQFISGNFLNIHEFKGATQHDQLEAAMAFIKKRGWGILEISKDTLRDTNVWYRYSALLVPSNCWIYLNDVELKLHNGVFDNIIRNDGIVLNANPFNYATALNENVNIRIFGNSKDTCYVSGPDAPYTAPHPITGGSSASVVPWVGDFYGFRTIGILLANVKNYKLHDFGMRKTTCWAISQEHGCDGFEVYNIGFDTHVKNGDGIDVRQGCKNGKIYNITGYTQDDTVALSAIQNFITQHPSGNYIYPMQVGGYGDRGFGGNIENVQVWNVKTDGLNNGVRLLASGGSKVTDVSIDNVSDNATGFTAGAVVLIGTGFGSSAVMGDIDRISVNGITSNASQVPLRLAGPVKDSEVNYITQNKIGGVMYDISTAELQNTTITNANEADTPLFPSSALNVAIIGDSTIAAGYYGGKLISEYITEFKQVNSVAAQGSTIVAQNNSFNALRNVTDYSVVIIQIGLNDMNTTTQTTAKVLADYQSLVNSVRAVVKPECKIYIAQMTPAKQRFIDVYGSTNGALSQQRWLDLNAAIASTITGVDGRITSHVAIMDDGSGNLKAEYDTGDHIHENIAGRQVIAAAWRDKLIADGVIAV